MTAPRLIFPAAPTEQSGFASADADCASRGYAEPVIRELLQNCLDARRSGVRFPSGGMSGWRRVAKLPGRPPLRGSTRNHFPPPSCGIPNPRLGRIQEGF